MTIAIDAYPRTTSMWQGLATIPREPVRAGEGVLGRGKSFPPMAYDDFDLWLSLEGCSTLDILGRTCSFDPGTCLLLPPAVAVVQHIAPQSDHRMVFFHFDIAFKGQILRDARPYVRPADGSGAPLMLTLPGLPAFALLTQLDTSRLADRVLRVARRWDDVAQLESQSLVMQVLAQHRLEVVRPASRRGRGLSVIDAALQYLEDNLHRPIFVADVADHVRLSPTHLTRLFRAQLQETPMQALLRIRLTRATALLQDPALNISEVAASSGFESLSFFTRVFSRKFGRPPTAYRRSLHTPLNRAR